MLDTWTPALLQASSDRGLVSTKGQFSGTSDSLVKLSRVSRGGGGGGDMMGDSGTSEWTHWGLVIITDVWMKTFLWIIRGRLCFAPSHRQRKASHCKIYLKRDKIWFCVNLSPYGATRTQPVAVSPFTANPVIHFFYWMTFRSHSPPTDILHSQLILFQFRNWQKSRNFSVWVSKSNLMMVSQITIMCMKSGQGETLRYDDMRAGPVFSEASRTKKGSEDQGSAGINNELWIFSPISEGLSKSKVCI